MCLCTNERRSLSARRSESDSPAVTRLLSATAQTRARDSSVMRRGIAIAQRLAEGATVNGHGALVASFTFRRYTLKNLRTDPLCSAENGSRPDRGPISGTLEPSRPQANQADYKDMVKSHWASPETVQRWESVYGQSDDFLSHTISKRMAAVVDLLRQENPADGPLVADVGCGSGLVSKELIHLGYDVTGVDISEPMLETARKVPGLKLEVGDVEHLRFAANAFDKIICLGVIGSLRDERKALAELHRVLKPHGTLILTVRNLLAASVLLDLPGIAVRITRKFRRRFQTGHHFHRNFIPWRLKRNLIAAGFTPSECTGLGYDFPTLNGKRVIPLNAALRFSGMVERIARHRTFGFLNNYGIFYLIVAQKQPD